ncbi:MAG: heparinase II/III domain-containing protein [Limisphaerales bacterium]
MLEKAVVTAFSIATGKASMLSKTIFLSCLIGVSGSLPAPVDLLEAGERGECGVGVGLVGMVGTGMPLTDRKTGCRVSVFLVVLFCVVVVRVEAVGGPRLFFTGDRVVRLRDRAASDPGVGKAVEDLVKRAERMLGERFVAREEAESGAGQHGNYGRPSGQMAKLGSVLGLAYCLTGDERYAVRLKEAMLHYGTYQRWAGDAGWDPPWHSELNTARFCFGFGVGYDSIRETLSGEERRRVVDNLVRLGIGPILGDWVDPERRIHALDSMGHNWWSVCVAMAGTAALAIMPDEERASGWVEDMVEGFPEWFEYGGYRLQNKGPNFDPGGAFYESVNYADYALREYLTFRLAYVTAMGRGPEGESALLAKAGDFFLHTGYPTSEGWLTVNFGDGSLQSDGGPAMRLLLANGFRGSGYAWYVHRTGLGLEDPVSLVAGGVDGWSGGVPELAGSIQYPEIGWAMMRDTWEDDATLLAVKSGFSWNHAHPDAGSCVLFHGGRPLIIDSGNCSYSRREYSAYYRQSRAHNVGVVEGEAHNPEDVARGDRGVAIPGRVDHLLDSVGVKYVQADATGPTSWKFSRNFRHFLWLDRVVLVVDDVRVHEPGELEWLLHYEGEAKVDGGMVLLENGLQSRAVVMPMFPEGLRFGQREGLKDHDPDTVVEYLAWGTGRAVRDEKFVTAIVPLGGEDWVTDGERVPDLERWAGGDAIGVRIRTGDRRTKVYLNLKADGRVMHRNSCIEIEGWETDAYLLAVTLGKGYEVERVVMIGGSYLRRRGEVWVDSLSKVYGVFGFGEDGVEVVLSGQERMRVRVRASMEPGQVRLNGVGQAVEYDSGRSWVTLRCLGN